MALTDEQRAYYKTVLGSTLDETDLETRYLRLGDDVLVATEVLDQRIADLLLKPLSFTVPGEYSEDRSKNLEMLREKRSQVAMSVVSVATPEQTFYR